MTGFYNDLQRHVLYRTTAAAGKKRQHAGKSDVSAWPIQMFRGHGTEFYLTTRGLGISDSPTSDNLSPQETTSQAAAEVGADSKGEDRES